MDCQFYCHICLGSFSSIVTLIAAVYEIVQTIFKDEQVRGTELYFCCSSAPRTPLTAGMTDVWTDGQTDIIKGLWASAVVLNDEDLVQDSMY